MIQRDMRNSRPIFICEDGVEFRGELDAITHETANLSKDFIDGVYYTISALEELGIDIPYLMSTFSGVKPVYIAQQVKKRRSAQAALYSLMP